MRWIFLTLLALNALVFGVQKIDASRNPKTEEPYQAHKDARTLVLLDEAETQRSEAVIRVPDIAKTRPALEPLCLVFGPVADANVANQLLSMANDYVSVFNLIEKEEPADSDYWVHLGPFTERKEALAQLRALQQQKIDSFLITEGELANGISLGLFRRKPSAEQLAADLAGKGWDAQVKEVERTSTRYWVGSTSPVNDDVKRRLSLALDGLQVSTEAQQIFCKSVATEVKSP